MANERGEDKVGINLELEEQGNTSRFVLWEQESRRTMTRAGGSPPSETPPIEDHLGLVQAEMSSRACSWCAR